MSNFFKRTLSLSLAFIILVSLMPAISTATDDEMVIQSAPSGKCLQAAFTDDGLSVDGIISETEWTFSANVGASAMFGALWDKNNVYLAVYNPNRAAVSITLGGTAINAGTAESQVVSAGQYVECGIPHGVIGSSVSDYGTQISATVQIGNDVWEGKIILSSTNWFRTESPTRALSPAARGSSQSALVDMDGAPNGYQGSQKIFCGWNFYDNYNPSGTNPRAVRTYMTYQGTYLAPLADRTTDTVLEYTFQANQMPVYELGYDNEFWNYITTAGFTYWITDGASKTRPNMACMGIINTDIGLVFVAQDPNGYQSYPLHKYVGDTFRVGNVWQPDGDVVLYIDGVPVTVFKNVQIFPMIEFSLPPNIITMNIMRSDKRAESTADNINVNITSMALGKAYGISIIDSLNFNAIKGQNTDASAVTYDLVLPAVFKSNQLPTAYTIKWTSSDPDLIDPLTGAVTCPATNGKTVTLTADVIELGVSKKIDLFVAGLNPTSDTLVVLSDKDTQNGAGTVYDAPTFTLDASNNSIIRDLKESKTVNVIALKDSDTVTRLNESMLTVWVSDTNTTYKQIDSFKILRAGAYTYLYDFEATGRYIKVHATTHDEDGSDFIGPVDGMIDAYYETAFGDNGTAFANTVSFEITNTSSSTAYDTVYAVSPAAAGINCYLAGKADIRFYLGDELLYHTYDGENFLVRVPKIAANSSAVLTILSGNTEAMDISNTEAVYEAVYGTRETYYSSPQTRYNLALPDGTLMTFFGANKKTDGDGYTNINYQLSYNEGRTWSSYFAAEGTADYIWYPQGKVYDDVSGRILVQGWKRPEGDTAHTVTQFMYSDDLGATWHKAPVTIVGQSMPYNIAYTDMIKISSYDGEDGPNVDFVMILSGNDTEDTDFTGDYPVACARAFYTIDGGKSWVSSESVIRYSKGEGYYVRETGLCEPSVLEAEDGTLAAYVRCQYENTDHFAVAYSYDHGITWTEDAVLSNVYTTNTQPYLFAFDEAKMLLWAANTVLGSGSYRRYPLNIAVSYDGMTTFENIQDVYSRTPFQGLLVGTGVDGVNPTATQIGDSLLLYCGTHVYSMRIDNFADYFFLTKGAYDSFENTPPVYEGWSTTGGDQVLSSDHATSGVNSMKFDVGASAVRSIPSVSNGTIAFDLWFDDAATADITVELETAYAVDYGTAAPVAFEIENGALTFLGNTVASNVEFKDGWNHFEFTLNLDSTVQSATLSVNGGAAVAAPINNGALNTSVCYVSVNCDGAHTYYLDTFKVVDNDEIKYVEKETKVLAEDLTYVPTALQATYTDTDALAGTLTQLMADTHGEEYAENSKIMDLSLLVSTDGAQSWNGATLADIPMNGIEIRLDYPEGTSADTHDFKLIHMFSEDSMRHSVTAGDWESPEITENEDGLYVRMMGFSPVILAWDQPGDAPADDSASTQFPIALCAAVPAVLVIGAATAIFLAKRSSKKRSA